MTQADGEDKVFHRIGEVSEKAGVPAHVLRYWESEFPQVRPRKGGGGQRLYRKEDIETILRIKELLYEHRFTVEGARKALRDERNLPLDTARIDTWIREVESIRELLLE